MTDPITAEIIKSALVYAAEGNERKVARIEAALDGYDSQDFRHRVLYERYDAGGRGFHAEV